MKPRRARTARPAARLPIARSAALTLGLGIAAPKPFVRRFPALALLCGICAGSTTHATAANITWIGGSGANYTGDYQAGSFVTVTAVPEPSAIVLLGIAAGIGAIIRRTRATPSPAGSSS